MSEERTPHQRAATYALQAVAHLAAQGGEIGGRGVGERGGIQVPPELFHRIQLRRVCRQPLDGQPGAVVGHRLGRELTPMSRQAIPQQDHPAVDMPAPRVEEVHDVATPHSPGLQRQEPARSPTGGRRQHGANPREVPPVEGLHHKGRAAFGGPGGANRGPLGKAAFVEKPQPGSQPLGFFLSRGQVVRTQRAIAASSRSRARRAGRWRLQPNWRSTRHVCGTEYRT